MLMRTVFARGLSDFQALIDPVSLQENRQRLRANEARKAPDDCTAQQAQSRLSYVM